MKLLIGTPIHYHPEPQYMISMLRLVVHLASTSTSFSLLTPVGESLITRARNSMVKKFLATDCTHLLFIDSDIEFQPEDVTNLLATGHRLVAGLYPKKHINWDNVRDAVADKEPNLQAHAADYVVNLDIGEHECTNGCVAVRELGTGFMLIERSVITDMQAAYPETRYLSDSDEDRGEETYALFDCVIEDGRYLSEDWTFCHRAKAIGIQPYAYLHAKLKHIGKFSYEGELSKLFIGLDK